MTGLRRHRSFIFLLYVSSNDYSKIDQFTVDRFRLFPVLSAVKSVIFVYIYPGKKNFAKILFEGGIVGRDDAQLQILVVDIAFQSSCAILYCQTV